MTGAQNISASLLAAAIFVLDEHTLVSRKEDTTMEFLMQKCVERVAEIIYLACLWLK